MSGLVLAVHERIATWARHLRPRAAGWPVRLVETRSGADLEAALAGSACPIVLVDVAGRPRNALEDLGRALAVAPEALALVLNPASLDGVGQLARELGAAHVIDGPVTPPAVAALLARWLPLAQRRAEAAGRVGSGPATQSEPGDWLTPLLGAATAPPWAPAGLTPPKPSPRRAGPRAGPAPPSHPPFGSEPRKPPDVRQD